MAEDMLFATLEEVLEADVILHVRDVSHGDTEAQAADVTGILTELGVDPHSGKLIEVWNKIDALDEETAARLRELAKREKSAPVVVSALMGEGVPALLDEIEARVSAGRSTLDLEVPAADGEGLHWLYEHTEVLERTDGEDGSLKLRVRVQPERAESVRRRFQPV
jgi:GTP-binding protein HflX